MVEHGALVFGPERYFERRLPRLIDSGLILRSNVQQSSLVRAGSCQHPRPYRPSGGSACPESSCGPKEGAIPPNAILGKRAARGAAPTPWPPSTIRVRD